MLGVVLCGGKSSRMNDDKGLLLVVNKSWAKAAQEKFLLMNLPTVLSVNEAQVEKYRLLFLKEQLIVDDAELALAGPLLGVLSVHIRFPNEDLTVLACDLPNMQQTVLEKLQEEHLKNNDSEAFVFKFAEQVEPLCGIYTSRGLAKILALYQTKNLAKHSMMYVLEQLNATYLIPKENWKPYFKNFNSPADF
jgi:molybdenum cofactor guanylyltransferase